MLKVTSTQSDLLASIFYSCIKFGPVPFILVDIAYSGTLRLWQIMCNILGTFNRRIVHKYLEKSFPFISAVEYQVVLSFNTGLYL